MGINFVKKGSGKTTLVFLHGWGGAWQSWAPIIDKLYTVYGIQYTVYSLDLPGFGLSSLPRAYGLSDYVEEIYSFIKKEILGPTKSSQISRVNSARMTSKIVLIGHSFGGQVTAKFALSYPNLISGLVLVDSAVMRNNGKMMRADIAVARFGKRLLQRTRLDSLYPLIRPFYYRFRGMDGSDYFKATGNENLRGTASKIFREDLSKEIHKIKVPTLIFWGEKDPPELTPLEFGKRIHEEIAGSKMVVVPGAGHFSYLEDQDLFISNLHKFITNLHK